MKWKSLGELKMPTPKKGENRKDYIKRCIPAVINEGTTKDNKQAAAICFSMWKDHHKKSKGEIILDDLAQEILNQKKNA